MPKLKNFKCDILGDFQTLCWRREKSHLISFNVWLSLLRTQLLMLLLRRRSCGLQDLITIQVRQRMLTQFCQFFNFVRFSILSIVLIFQSFCQIFSFVTFSICQSVSFLNYVRFSILSVCQIFNFVRFSFLSVVIINNFFIQFRSTEINSIHQKIYWNCIFIR